VIIRKSADLTPLIGDDWASSHVGMPELGFTTFPPDAQCDAWHVKSVKPDALAAHYGLRAGHRILRINNESVQNTSLTTFQELILSNTDRVTLEVEMDSTFSSPLATTRVDITTHTTY
jgi:C-terminal processing protease CtpA/Prc